MFICLKSKNKIEILKNILDLVCLLYYYGYGTKFSHRDSGHAQNTRRTGQNVSVKIQMESTARINNLWSIKIAVHTAQLWGSKNIAFRLFSTVFNVRAHTERKLFNIPMTWSKGVKCPGLSLTGLFSKSFRNFMGLYKTWPLFQALKHQIWRFELGIWKIRPFLVVSGL